MYSIKAVSFLLLAAFNQTYANHRQKVEQKEGNGKYALCPGKEHGTFKVVGKESTNKTTTVIKETRAVSKRPCVFTSNKKVC